MMLHKAVEPVYLGRLESDRQAQLLKAASGTHAFQLGYVDLLQDRS
jgi:hypothetical protein